MKKASASQHVLQDKTTDMLPYKTGITRVSSVIDSTKTHLSQDSVHSGFGVSMLIGSLLVIPVMIIIVATIFVRLYKTGKKSSIRKFQHLIRKNAVWELNFLKAITKFAFSKFCYYFEKRKYFTTLNGQINNTFMIMLILSY